MHQVRGKKLFVKKNKSNDEKKLDVDILGLSLELVELHLWWLLVFRARSKLMSRQLEIDNKICYHIPSFVAHHEEEKRKCALLTSYEVEVCVIDAQDGDWHGFYNTALNNIKKK